ncbi:MAG: helicase [Bacteroidia bacterium]|nr:helicase-related protein [Paludibacter sp.]NCB68296.1 helicase [Bacteroidia bacterium]
MLLDNKTKTEDSEYYKVFDFLKNYTEKGELDLVTGFFSVHALALMHEEMNQAEKFRMILGNLMQDENQLNRVVDLLNGDAGIESTLSLSNSALKAVEFLQQEKVAVKSTQRNFCHAKAYIYTDKDARKNYEIIGSSNLTDAGLGLKESSNIELNTATTGNDNEFKELKKWFKNQWDKVAEDKIELPDKTRVDVKQHLIELITNLWKPWEPIDLYYKVLYELFKDDLLSLSTDAEFKREIAHLEETDIYKTLFPYQQKGAISLIKMLQKFNGAILADAVGLGKTWTALAVMKYFEIKGYTVILFCPKKLRNNWEQYRAHSGSRFDNDELEYFVRNHTDLQDERLTSNYPDFSLGRIQRKQKLLIVIDESHNLRNDKSSRYKFLVEKVLLPERKNRDIKVLQLSATPINNKLMDIRNQFKLMTKGLDDGFKDSELEIESLENVFRTAQKDFGEWSATSDRKIADFINKLPAKFEKLTDALIVARTRKLIEGEFGEMNFPRKADPINEYVAPENFGDLKSFDDILNALRVNLTAYRPSEYIKDLKVESVLENPKQREKFLVKMMYMLLMKRLESSWFSFKVTVENILNHHINALNKVDTFIRLKEDAELEEEFTEDEQDELEETAAENNEAEIQPITLGKKNPISLSAITNIDVFRKHLEADVVKLKKLQVNLEQYETAYRAGNATDEKLDKLIEHIQAKQKSKNKKILVFTVFKDTAQFLYDELNNKGFRNVAFVSGSISQTNDGYIGNKFEPILERFAPFTKLYNEKDWSWMYTQANLGNEYKNGERWKVSYEKWLELVQKYDKTTFKKIDQPIDILIATDCLSEGQNLQDCDTVVNYDIHWNPVRLIQRMGRIDRLGSPNKIIKGINFWPGKNYEDYLRLKSRVENRMALMSVVGTELDDKLTPEFERMVEENPLLPKQAQKMLQQLQITWDDLETSDETLGLNDLSLEQFRQELFEFFKKNEEFFQKIPNGVYSGFKFRPNKKWREMPESVIAVLGYPRRPDEAKNHVYDEIHLIHNCYNDSCKKELVLNNNQEILAFLKWHKAETRFVPRNIEQGDSVILSKIANSVSQWVENQAAPVSVNQIQDLFSGTLPPQKISPTQKKLEDKYKKDNFDLINWFVISNK